MSTPSASRRREGRALVLALVLLTAGLAGCTDEDDAPPAESPLATTVEAEVESLLSRRVKAVRAGNLPRFLDDVGGSTAFRQRQRRYFLNLRELPLKTFTYVVPEGGISQAGRERVRAVVHLRLQLRGYDAVPVETPYLLGFRRADDGELRLVDDRDRRFERRNDIESPPWDLTRTEVQQGDGVLGIFDADSVDAAYRIIDAVEDGISDVSTELPLPWSERVVVYALSDLTVLSELDNLPGGDPNLLDAVAFPVRAGPRATELASTRFMFHPRMVHRADATRDRLIRHELTHVAIGTRDDHVPTWLSEGIAEYVSVQPLPSYRRMISRDAVAQARGGLDQLPSDQTFNGPFSGANYGVAWYACEYVASAFGEEALWRLFDEMRRGKGTSEENQDRILRNVLGLDSRELARAAGQKILATFD